MPQTLSQAQMYGRAGGLRTRATHDPVEHTSPARRAFYLRFERQADPDGTLPPDERMARADALRRSYMAQLAARSVSVRAASPTPVRVAEVERRVRILEQIVGRALAEDASDG